MKIIFTKLNTDTNIKILINNIIKNILASFAI